MDEAEVEKTRLALESETRRFDLALSAFPFAAPTVAFASYEWVARSTRAAIDLFGQRNAWFSADGNAYEIEILAPLINGVVMPAIAIALGTAAATTISTLRERQLAVRSTLNKELTALELLRGALNAVEEEDFADCAPAESSVLATRLLRDYVARLIVEARPGTTVTQLVTTRVAENELVRLSTLFHYVDDRRRRSEPVTTTAQNLIHALADYRATRLAEEAATYPTIHYAILAGCSLSIIASFLLESDQEVLRFLDAIQLRLLFAILVGVFSGIAALIVDLSDLYRGAFRVTTTYAQLIAIHDNLEFDRCRKRAGAPLVFTDLVSSNPFIRPTTTDGDNVQPDFFV